MMRFIVFFLVTLNIFYLGWNLYRGPEVEAGARPQPPMPATVQPLVTLQERPHRQQAGAGADNDSLQQKVELPVNQVPLSCKSLGPFLDQTGLDAATGRFADIGLSTVLRSIDKEVIGDYWVYLSADSRKQLRENVSQLKAKNITDYHEIGDNAISLGVFRSEQRAHARLDKIRSLGLKADLEERYKTQTQYWLDMTETDASEALMKELAQENPELGIESLECEQMMADQPSDPDTGLPAQARLPD